MGSETFSDQDVEGGRFISSMAGGQMMAAFFHPTKKDILQHVCMEIK